MSGLPLKRRILIVGEGRETEYNYFVGFRSWHKKELQATATSIRVVRGKGGNATNIVRHAITEAKRFEPRRRFGDRVFLLLDTEGAGRAPELPDAERLAQQNVIEIVYSSPALEYWLLCHFNNPPRRYFKDCDAVIGDLNKKWGKVCRVPYDKSDQDIFDRLRSLLPIARDQALKVDLHHLKSNDSACGKNPSTQVYELIALLIGTRTGEACPIEGPWKRIDDAAGVVKLAKGSKMPLIKGVEATWQIDVPINNS